MVGRCPLSVENTGLSEKKRPSANRHEHITFFAHLADPGHNRWGLVALSRDHYDVWFRCIFEGVVGIDAHTAGYTNFLSRLRDRVQMKRMEVLVCLHLGMKHHIAEDFPRAGKID